MDKASIAGLAATLLHYLRGEALEAVPVWRMISATAESLEQRMRTLAARLGPAASTQPGRSVVGGGSLPDETLPTHLLAIRTASSDAMAATLRRHDPPVVCRIEHQLLLFDPRTIDPSQDADVSTALFEVIAHP